MKKHLVLKRYLLTMLLLFLSFTLTLGILKAQENTSSMKNGKAKDNIRYEDLYTFFESKKLPF